MRNKIVGLLNSMHGHCFLLDDGEAKRQGIAKEAKKEQAKTQTWFESASHLLPLRATGAFKISEVRRGL